KENCTAIHSRQVDFLCDSRDALWNLREDLEKKFQYYRDREDSYAYGTRKGPCQLLSAFGLDPASLSWDKPPRGAGQLIYTEIRALQAYGRLSNDIRDTILGDEEALEVACQYFRWRSPLCARLATKLVKLLKDEIRRTQQLMESARGHERVKLLQRLEWM